MPTFFDQLNTLVGLLEREGRLSYRAIQRELDVDDDLLADLTAELIEVKGIARDIDGKMLELAGAVSHKVPPRRSQEIERAPAVRQEWPVHSRPDVRHREAEEADVRGEVRGESAPVKKTLLIWIGGACILVGVLLPWVTATMDVPGFTSQSRSVNGLELNQGLLSIGVGIAGALLSFAAARRTVPARFVALAIIVTGVVVMGVAFDVIDGIGSSDLGLDGTTVARLRQVPEPGVFMTLVGGGLLSLGGLVALFRTKRRVL